MIRSIARRTWFKAACRAVKNGDMDQLSLGIGIRTLLGAEIVVTNWALLPRTRLVDHFQPPDWPENLDANERLNSQSISAIGRRLRERPYSLMQSLAVS